MRNQGQFLNEVKVQADSFYGSNYERWHSNGPFILTKTKNFTPPLYNKTGHWNEKQNMKYYVFLKKYHEKFAQKQKRRQEKVFKTLAEFIKTRNPNQCRSHHHKMQKDFRTISEILQYIKSKVKDVEKKLGKYENMLDQFVFPSFVQEEERIDEKHSNIRKDCSRENENSRIDFKMVKKEHTANMNTGISYDEVEKKPSFLNFNTNAYFPEKQTFEGYHHEMLGKFKHEKAIQCQQYFLRWWNKLSALMQMEERAESFDNVHTF